jgi:ABC-type nickel/cobalt efflux system permease component RcnA
VNPAILLQRGAAVLIIGIASYLLWRDRKPKGKVIEHEPAKPPKAPAAVKPPADDPDPARKGADA